MMSEKDKYERLICQTKLFSIDKDTEYTAYHRESLRLIENLYQYLMAIGENKYRDFGLEITETAKRCIRGYKKESGEFLHYFLAAWKKEYRHAIGRKLVDSRFGGIGFSEDDFRGIRLYLRLCEKHGNDPTSPETIATIARLMGKTVEQVLQIREMAETTVVSDTYEDNDGCVACLFDTIENGGTPENYSDSLESCFEILDCLSTAFESLQHRQRPLLSQLITMHIAGSLQNDPKLLTYAREKSFFNEPVYCVAVSNGITAREVAISFGLSEASVSRSWSTFIRNAKHNQAQTNS